MISAAEGRYLYWLTSAGYTGGGAVVEVGTWLGRSTVHLAAGLRDAGFPRALHCFDQFVWQSDHRRKAALPLRRGDDFQGHFERNVRPVYPGLQVTRAALDDLVWTGGPIEILFLDAPKQLPDISAALQALAGALVPGLSLLVLQDYLHVPSFALPAVMSRLGGALEPLHIVTGSPTVAFAVKRPIEVARAQPADWNFMRWSADEVFTAWRTAADRLPDEARARLWLGAALLFDKRGQTHQACEILRDVARDPALRPHLDVPAVRRLGAGYRSLFRAAGLDLIPAGRGPRLRLKPALRRARDAGRRLISRLGGREV
jgi:hypothetical protein